jgi:DNA-binding response OmpR family regulator
MPQTSPRATRTELDDLAPMLDALDAADQANAKAKQRRKYERLKYRCGPIGVDLAHPGGSSSKVNVFMRNLSAGGACCVISGFVHPGTRCTVHLTNVMGRPAGVKGVVRWCTHVQGRMHQMGMTFVTPIDPRQYLNTAECREGAAASTSGQLVPARILYIDDESLGRELIKMSLRNSPMRVDCADSPAEARAALSRDLYDVIITDLHLGDEMAFDLIRSIRTGGFRGPILVLTVDTSSGAARHAVEAGADEVIRKPYDAGSLLLRVTHQIRSRNMPTGDEPIYSQVEDVLSLTEPVLNYIEEARRKLPLLDRALQSNDVPLARSVCEALMATGTGFGFPIITETASLAMWTVNETNSVTEARDELRRLSHIVGRLAVRDRPGTAEHERTHLL